MQRPLWLFLLSLCLACNNGGFGGTSGKKASSKDHGDARDSGDVDDRDDAGDGEDDGGDTDDGTSGGLAPGALDDDGTLTDDCRVVTDLPGKVTKPVELFHWVASGPTATFNQVMATPVVGKLSASANPVIVATAFPESCDYVTAAKLYAIDGKTGDQLWVADVTAIPANTAAIGDVDGDGSNDVLYYSVDGKVYALKGDGTPLWTSNLPAIFNNGNAYADGGPTVVDLDGDGDVEVVTQKQVFDGKTGEAKFPVTGTAMTIVADTDGEPGLEIVTSAGIYKKDGQALCTFPAPLSMIAARKVAKDDGPALIVGTNELKAFGFDGKTCAQRFATDFPGGGGGAYNMGDLDGDGKLDFVSAGKSAITAFDGNGAILWTKPTKDASSAVTGSTMFDFNGDGKTEVVYNDEDFLRVFDGKTGKVLYEIENSSGTLVEYPVVADVDGNGHANIVVGANDCFDYTNRSAKGIRVFKDKDESWIGTRKLWNQFAYDPLLVSNSGSLTGVDPAKIYKPWLKSPHLAGFRNNIPHPAVKDSCKAK